LVGATPTVIRAAVMGTIVVIGWLWNNMGNAAIDVAAQQVPQ
jgi:hypothetical protein